MDSYKVKIKEQNEWSTKNDGCFSAFNNYLAGKTNVEYASIIIEQNKCEQHENIEDVYFFLEEIKKINTVDFTVEKFKNDIHLKLNVDNIVFKKSYLQYTGMLVRCLYKGYDDFVLLGDHFIQLCKYFPKMDRGILFTFSCNLYIANYNVPKDRYGWNSNHILMEARGCKILNTEEIKLILDKNNGINNNFTTLITKDNYILPDDSRNSYIKVMEKNGIKFTKE